MPGDKLDRERVKRIVQAMPALVGATDDWNADEISAKDVLDDYFRVMEIAHYLRRGGVKAVMYRIETGRAQLAPTDYFDEAQEKLSQRFRDHLAPPDPTQSVLERLSAVAPEEEEIVRDFLPQIDEILLSSKRKDAAV